MVEQAWVIIGYKNGRGKKPRKFDKIYFGDVIGKDEAMKRAQNIFCFSQVTDAIESGYTRLDRIKEVLHDTMWLWIPAILIVAGFALGIHFNTIWPIVIGWSLGLGYGIGYAPHSPV